MWNGRDPAPPQILGLVDWCPDELGPSLKADCGAPLITAAALCDQVQKRKAKFPQGLWAGLG